MKRTGPVFDFILREWLLLAGISGALLTSFLLRQPPIPSPAGREVLFLLWALFTTVKGLELSGAPERPARRIERSRFVATGLVTMTFFLSAFLTNDAALAAIVPLTLTLRVERKGLLVTLEALAANAGSALTPFGNPQNLFIAWHYHVGPWAFIRTIAPFSFFCLVLLLAATLRFDLRRKSMVSVLPETTSSSPIRRTAWGFLGLFLIVPAVILHLFPFYIALPVPLLCLLLDRRSLRVDYGLLFTLGAFLVLTDHLHALPSSGLEHSEHVFLVSAAASQLVSNVPAALLIAPFTAQWRALLWGVNVGGFGHLFASLANLIAWRFYLTREKDPAQARRFSVNFLLWGYSFFFLSAILYYLALVAL